MAYAYNPITWGAGVEDLEFEASLRSTVRLCIRETNKTLISTPLY